MATVSRTRRTADARSGGKIVRDRRIAAAKTPYDRPTLPTPTQNRNWLTGVVFPATRMIATGAGKLFSFVAGADSSSSSSDSDSEDDDADNDNDEHHILPDEADGLNKNGASSQTIKCFRKEPQVTVGKSETKCVIERLLMQETFSREECDRLIKIINSRVVDYSTIKEGQNDVPDLCSKAVMEAKRWLEEKKVGSSSKSNLDHVTFTFNSVELQPVTEGEVGSPVDVAKSYMRSRSPWVSPISHVDLKTPSPVGIEPSKEGASFPVGNSFSSSKKRDSLATGSWNILEEVRRVRSKATDDMLRTLPSRKIDLSLFAQEPKASQNFLVAGETEAVVENKMQESNSLTAAKTIDASANLAAGVSISHVVPVSEMTQDGSHNKALSSSPAIFVSEQNQDMEASPTIKGEGVDASESHHSTVPDFASNQHNDSRSSNINGSTAKEVTELRSTSNANGFPYSEFSLSAGLDAEKDPRPSDSENLIPVDSSHDKLNTNIPVEETCKLLSETSVEVPVVDETNIIAGDSENSSSMHYEVLPSKRTRLNPTRNLAGKRRNMVEKQEEKRSNRYNRKERGRGRGRGK
ncbi:protein KAKU4 isoform X2 [Cornus florida]|uniref:protein KAKU4 isoform X2 n=1 Tax=Cornus florida TaxID=4283 RepID=UPI00289ECED2|nr:protein KAKU4 isoform X2 [Cornus florida]